MAPGSEPVVRRVLQLAPAPRRDHRLPPQVLRWGFVQWRGSFPCVEPCEPTVPNQRSAAPMRASQYSPARLKPAPHKRTAPEFPVFVEPCQSSCRIRAVCGVGGMRQLRSVPLVRGVVVFQQGPAARPRQWAVPSLGTICGSANPTEW